MADESTQPTESQDVEAESPKAPAVSRKKRDLRKILEAQRVAREGREYQLWQACGKQISSLRPTVGGSTFGAPRLLPASGERLCGVPMMRSPGPIYDVKTKPKPTTVLKDWGRGPRFLQADGQTGNAAARAVKTSTHASVFSKVYPYEEVSSPPPGSPAASLPRAATDSDVPSSARTPRRWKNGATWEEAERQRRRQAPHLIPDYNMLRFRYPIQPAWSFSATVHKKKQLLRDLLDDMPLEVGTAASDGAAAGAAASAAG